MSLAVRMSVLGGGGGVNLDMVMRAMRLMVCTLWGEGEKSVGHSICLQWLSDLVYRQRDQEAWALITSVGRRHSLIKKKPKRKRRKEKIHN